MSGIFAQNTEMESGDDPEDKAINGGDIENILNLVEEVEKLEDVNKNEDPKYSNIEEKEVKSTLECLDYLKEIHNRFVAARMEPPLESRRKTKKLAEAS